MTGRLIGVVGPSGVGKDSLMRAISEAMPKYGIVRRVITRAPGLGGEDYESVDATDFALRKAKGAFCIDWQAHGLWYGIPHSTRIRVEAGEVLMVNLSRSVLTVAAYAFRNFTVLNLTARPEVLEQRLTSRGRESPDDIRDRLNRRAGSLPAHISVVTIENNGTLEDTATVALRHLPTEGAS
ncbi:MAG: phosphonate metabolism protein/1,5-bisphosphokinase (PRPP-forming) PhnN [Pseudomonadota bacterium]